MTPFGSWKLFGMGKIILCIGNSVSYDCHIDSIEKHVKALDSEAKLLRLDVEVDSNFIEINTGGNPEKATSCFVIVDGERIPSESITSVWYFWMPCYPETDNLLGNCVRLLFIMQAPMQTKNV